MSTTLVPLATAISTEVRRTIVQSLLEGLQQKYDHSSVLLCSTLLLDEDKGDLAQRDLAVLLSGRILVGDEIENVIDAAVASSWLRVSLLQELVALLMSHQQQSGGIQASDISIRLLSCVKRLISVVTPSTLASQVLTTALQYMCCQDRKVAFAAREAALMSLSVPGVAAASDVELRECTRLLLSHDAMPFQQNLGVSLWLRRLVMIPRSFSELIRDPSYWYTIAKGLRHGDSERRKICLEILKLSLQQAVQGDEYAAPVTSKTTISPATLLTEYARYCTVFETLTLARYHNLLRETERDLNYLASDASAVHPVWRFTLLEVALDLGMHDPGRQTIGNWIISGNLRLDTQDPQSQPFLEQSLLPWLTEGHLFVSSLSQLGDRSWQCVHGNQVVAFIQETMHKSQSVDLFESCLRFILEHRGRIFSYSAVYVMHGLARSADSVTLNLQACQYVLELAQWQSLPEVAKECFRRDCLTIAQSQSAQSILETAGLELQTQAAILRRRYNVTPMSDDIHAGIYYTGRELKVKDCLQRCQQIRSGEFDKALGLADVLDDIWSEAEYLVFPKELLEAIPGTLLCTHVISAATTNEGIAAVVVSTMQRLVNMLETRSNLLAPIIVALIAAKIRTPEVLHLLPIDALILQIAQAPPEPKSDMKLEYAVMGVLNDSQDKTQHRGASEGHGYAAYLYLVATLSENQNTLKAISQNIITRWRQQKIPPPAVSAFKTTLQLQLLILSLEHRAPVPQAELDQTLDDLFYLLSIEPLPRYRYLLSWMILRLLLRFPNQHERLSTQLSVKDHHSNPKYLASLMKMSVELLTAADVVEAFALKLASSFIALSASSKIVIRHEAQWSFPLLMDLARARNWSQICNNLACTSLDEYIRSLPRFGEPPLERIYSKFDLVSSNTLTNLAEGPWTELDWNGLPIVQRDDFVSLFKDMEDSGLATPIPCLQLGSPVEHTQRLTSQFQTKPEENDMQPILNDESVALQTKGSAYLESMLRNEGHTERRHKLIVLASLVTNPYNLGGLSRVSEIFGVQTMYVGDTKVTAHKDFTSVAVSSDQHLDIQAMPQNEIATFLAAKKAEGWVAVGVEQTDRSDMLGDSNTRLPDKTILLIGNEREGMPGSVIGLCDVLIEIPQVGVTRSMNVQTVAAVVLYEFNRQRGRVSSG